MSPPHAVSPGDKPTSVRLSCLSPNDRWVHSLSIRNSVAYIESNSLPLAGTIEEATGLAKIETMLPDRVYQALTRYPALELLCVDVESKDDTKIPRLCLYTSKDVFFLELAYTAPSDPEIAQVPGRVISISEPFEEVLLGQVSIVRIRPAPHRHRGYATLCPSESMAMLTHNGTTNEYALHLHHENGGLSNPLVHALELLEGSDERITDFVFLKSTAFPLLSSLSVALLKGSGDVLVATPILFQGTVVPSSMVCKTLEILACEFQKAEHAGPRWRQCRIAQAFLHDCFPDDGTSPFITAQTRHHAAQWPTQVQGPVLVAAESDDYASLASSIENVVAGDLIGVAIGHLGQIVEFGLLSPTTMIPRFQIEKEIDTPVLDEELKWGAIVSRVDLSDDEAHTQPYHPCVTLISDPIMDGVVHYVAPSSIISVSTNMLKITAHKVREQAGMFSPQTKSKPRTTAWCCLSVAKPSSVVGAVVSGDIHFGHVLISRFSGATMVSG